MKPTRINSADEVSTASHWELLGNRNDVAARVTSKINKLQSKKRAVSQHSLVLYDCVSRDCVATTTRWQLLEIYQKTTEGFTEEDFDIETDDYLKNGPTGKAVRHTLFAESECQSLPTCQAALVIAHAYLADSYIAHEKKDDELAWSRIAEARYWVGVAAIAEQGAKISQDTAIHTGAEGGLTTSKRRILEVKTEAFRFVRGMPINLSIKERAEATRDWIIDFAVEANKSRADNKLLVITAGESGAKTVRGWFRAMSDAKELKLD